MEDGGCVCLWGGLIFASAVLNCKGYKGQCGVKAIINIMDSNIIT